jgi:hypothetical protein
MAIEFEITFNATKGINWPCVSVLSNDKPLGSYTVTDEKSTIVFEVNNFENLPNNLSIVYFNKNESETIVKNGKIVQDQSLELIKIRADGILLESWFWTDNYYYPNYFEGYLKNVNDAPKKIMSQLHWHFPGKFVITELPNCNNFWQWYKKQRTNRVLAELIDPTGQIKNNYNSITDEDRLLLAELKEILLYV